MARSPVSPTSRGGRSRWTRLLSPASEQLAAAPFRLADGRAASWGIVLTTGTINGYRAYGHPGGPALGDIIRVPTQKLTVVVPSNQKAMYPNTASVIARLYLPKATLPEPIREAPELRRKLEAVDPSLIAALPRLGRIELVRENRYRATYGYILVACKIAPDGELTQFIEQPTRPAWILGEVAVAPQNSDVETDTALGRFAPSGSQLNARR